MNTQTYASRIDSLYAGNSNILHGLFRPTMLSKVVAAVKGWRSRSAAMRELHSMPDALLRDIGIERSQISEVVASGGQRAPVRRMHIERFSRSAESQINTQISAQIKQAA